MKARGTAAAVVAAVLLLGASSSVQAHELRRSQSNLLFMDDGVQVAVSMPRSELGDRSPESVRGWFSLGDAGAAAACESTAARLTTRRSAVQVRWTWRCSRVPVPVLRVDFGDASAGHLHAARVVTRDGQVADVLLTLERPDADLREPVAPSFVSVVATGARHVAGGLDHLAFVLALMLLGGSLGGIALIATGFTLGHSVTLGLAALGLVTVDEQAVEVLVGLSVAYAALACFHRWLPPDRRGRVAVISLGLHAALWPWLPAAALIGSAAATTCHLGLQARRPGDIAPRVALAALFGLVHGLAFAGAFGELLAGGELIVGLLGFNLGVELAQLVVIVAAVAVLRACAAMHLTHVPALTAACVLAAGVGWTFTRAGFGW